MPCRMLMRKTGFPKRSSVRQTYYRLNDVRNQTFAIVCSATQTREHRRAERVCVSSITRVSMRFAVYTSHITDNSCHDPIAPEAL